MSASPTMTTQDTGWDRFRADLQTELLASLPDQCAGSAGAGSGSAALRARGSAACWPMPSSTHRSTAAGWPRWTSTGSHPTT